MSVLILSNSRRVLLPLQLHGSLQGTPPDLRGLLVSEVKAGGGTQEFFAPLSGSGIPAPFRGDRWCYAWRDEAGIPSLWVGFPDVVFSAHIDFRERLSVEALIGESATWEGLLSVARLEITLKPPPGLTLEAGWGETFAPLSPSR